MNCSPSIAARALWRDSRDAACRRANGAAWQPDQPRCDCARFLLKAGRKYEQAVKAFEPYDSIKEENPEARAAGRALTTERQAAGLKRRTFVFVNNRLEGNAISTIAAMMQAEA